MAPRDDPRRPEAIDLDAPAGETLVQGAGRPARRPRWWTTPVQVGVVVLVVAALLGDRSLRERELDALVADVETASVAVALADQRIAATQQFVRPVGASGASTSGLAADADGVVARAAARGAEEVRARRDEVDDATVVPWHPDLREARAAVGAYLATQVERLAAARVSDRPTEDAALAEAVAQLREAVPPGPRAQRLEAAIRELPGGRADP